MSAASPAAPGIDPRGPRFGAAITSVLLLVTVGLALVTPISATAVDRLLEPAALLLVVLVALFAWGAFAGIQRHPYGAVFRALVAPRLGPPSEREDPAAPTFAQGVGLLVTGTGLVLHLLGVPGALAVAAAAAFVAAFLNAAFAYCLGCQMYVLLVRAGLIGRRAA
ncbi:DUF4395 domain-containing protein [Microcella alkaliphila]|uniref:DUF4395 domain-containing protein n=1 Tax=Microcella alkaliphila TaxID=279828 RepID=A0A0U5BM95_9MICO|nr:DUF4395 domain-containing protein [Microcella alkaliphila]BAU31963.1 uncharacterized protein MalAC0309_1102 [Microcella alkaliphila]